ncbi:hypothetical protein H4S08_002773 [Coemansia sp. RSA 1365]|nr:hypothetical protein H4S08_002773 [Coemansia sp. RSA 1365]
MANNKSNIVNQADDLNDHQQNDSHKKRQIKSEEFSNRIVTTAATTNAQSLPNIRLNYKESVPANAALYGYADLFAESYSSDSENDADDQEEMGLPDQLGDYVSTNSMSPVEATVLGFERSTPRLPVLRIGAARLSEMVHAPRIKARAEANNNSILVNYAESDTDRLQTEQYQQQRIKQNLHPHQRSIENKVLDNDADGAATILPKRLARAITIKREKQTGCNSQESLTAIPVDDDNGSTLHQSPSNGSSSRETQNNRYPYADATLNILEKDEKGEDVFNGLLAPGAFGDEKQRAKADGSKFQRLLYILQGSRREREARLFKPIVVNPITTDSDSKGRQHNPDGTITRQTPWFDDVEDEDRFDGVTGNRIIDTTLKNLPVAALKMQFHSANTIIRYLTSDMADPALVDLFGKCAPKNSIVRKTAAAENNNMGRPGALTIRFQISVNMRNLGWIKQPIVTLNQKVECPE